MLLQPTILSPGWPLALLFTVWMKGDRTVHTVSSVVRMDTRQCGAYDELSNRETGTRHCKGATSDRTANAPTRLCFPKAGQA